jgi:hypothetical protein
MTPVPASQEVRRCAKCHEAAVVLVFEWKQSYGGVDSGTSVRDYRCQACGARFSLHPRVTNITFMVIGLVMGLAIFPLGFTIFGWVRLRRDKANPVVPGAARPAMRFRDGPPARQCGKCGEELSLKGITRHTSRGLPTGTTYDYGCPRCPNAFTIESAWGQIFSALSGVLVGAIGVGFFFGATGLGWKYGGSIVFVGAALFMFWQVFERVQNRLKNPEFEPPVARRESLP